MGTELLGRLWRRAESLGKHVWDEWLTDDERAATLGLAAKGLQQGKQLVDQNSTKVLSVLGLATQHDLRRISTKVGRLRKQLQNLQAK